eukprot:gene39003-52692_t
MGLAAVLANARGDLLAGVRLAAGDHHMGALLGKQARRGFANAARGAGGQAFVLNMIEAWGSPFVVDGKMAIDKKKATDAVAFYAGLLTIFRHHDNAFVKNGLIGAMPETLW